MVLPVIKHCGHGGGGSQEQNHIPVSCQLCTLNILDVKSWVLVVTIWLELCMSYSSSCHHHLHSSLAAIKLANPGSPGKWLLKRRERSCQLCTLNIPALCHAMFSMVLPRTLVWSMPRLVTPQTTGWLAQTQTHCMTSVVLSLSLYIASTYCKYYFTSQYFFWFLQCSDTVSWATGSASGLHKLGVGLLMVTIWLELCTSYSSSCHTTHQLHHP